jgi:NADPH-dependent 7-cyano-7-deazaguanine reductase QueF
MYTPMLTTALFTIVKRWIQPKYLSVVDYINKRRHIHTMGYYSALKRKTLTHATMWINLKNIMLDEIN